MRRRKPSASPPPASRAVQLVLAVAALLAINSWYLGHRLRAADEGSVGQPSNLEDRLAQRANQLLKQAGHERYQESLVDDAADASTGRAAGLPEQTLDHEGIADIIEDEEEGNGLNESDEEEEQDTIPAHNPAVAGRSTRGPDEPPLGANHVPADASELLDKYQALLNEASGQKDEAKDKPPAGGSGEGLVEKRRRRRHGDLQASESNSTSRSRPSDGLRLKIMGSTDRTDKVAFLFLTRGRLPFEKVWAKFFGQDSLGRHSIFVHAPQHQAYPPDSIWHGRKLPARSVVKVMWGEPSMVEAERVLLQHALLDPGIAKFALVSESDIPVQNFECAHKMMTEKPHSFAQSVPMTSQMPPKLREFMSPKDWRKGSQWFVLNREHAQMVADDRELFPLFKRHCTIYSLNPCIADEHYIPTLLAYKKAEATTQLLRHSLTWTDWHKGSPSPETVGKNAPVKSKMQDIRRCHYSGPNHSKKVFYPLMMREDCGEKVGEEYFSGLGNINDADEIRRPCFVFARKFAPELANKISGSFESVVGSPGRRTPEQ